MRRAVIAVFFAAAFSLLGAAPALAANPPGTGQPGQDCGEIGVFPGHTTTSPGSPFNEGVGTGGLNYNETSQYDVACFQLSQQH